MKPATLVTLLQIGGVLYLGLIAAGAAMPRAVNLYGHVKSLPTFVRRLFYVYLSFIGLCLACFGVITFVFAKVLASGEPLARAVCLFLFIFWSMRLLVATFVFDVRPYLTNWTYRVGYQATNAVFVYLVVIYALATMKGVWS